MFGLSLTFKVVCLKVRIDNSQLGCGQFSVLVCCQSVTFRNRSGCKVTMHVSNDGHISIPSIVSYAANVYWKIVAYRICVTNKYFAAVKVIKSWTVVQVYQGLTRDFLSSADEVYPCGVNFDPKSGALVLNGLPGHLQFYSLKQDALLFNVSMGDSHYIFLGGVCLPVPLCNCLALVSYSSVLYSWWRSCTYPYQPWWVQKCHQVCKTQL